MSGAEGSQQHDSTLAYPALLVLGALDAAGYSVLAPVLPTIAARIDSGPASMGLLVACFPGAMLAAFAVAGYGLRREPVTWNLLVGAVIILAGVAVSEGRLRRRAEARR